MKTIEHLLLLLVGLMWSETASALSFSAQNDEGVTINYQTTSDGVAVTSGNYSGRVVIPETVMYNGNAYSVTSIASLAFNTQESLTSVVIPNSVTAIGEQAFINCISLSEISLPDSLSLIPQMCFTGCISLNAISFSNSINVIGSSAFNRTGLVDVIIPESVSLIGENAFNSCRALKSVDIPSSVTTIGSWAFGNCQNLTKVISRIREPFFVDNVFMSISPSAILYVPAGTKTLYENTTGWDFSSIVEMGSEESLALSINDTILNPGLKKEIAFNLYNGQTPIIGCQFDLTLPEGISLTNFDNGYGGVINRERCPDFTGRITSAPTNGVYTVVMYSESNQPMTGSDGTILSLMLLADEDILLGTYNGTISNITIVKEDNTKIYFEDVTFNIIVKNVKGDVNGDGSVDVQDITEIAKYIVHQTNEIDSEAADMDEDNIIDVADITLVVKAIMETRPINSRMIENAVTTSDSLSLISTGNGKYAINLTNHDSYVASQFDIRIPEGNNITLEKSSRCENHQLYCERVADDIYRVVIYSLNNETYVGNGGTLLTMSVEGSSEGISLENTLFVNEGQNKAFFGSIPVTDGIRTVFMNGAADNIYTIDGRKVVPTGNLPKGMYIINEKIVVVK